MTQPQPHLWRPWRAAMADALYGADGFYLSAGTPGRHFRTAAHAAPAWAAAMLELAGRVDAALGEPAEFTVVDLGAGGGELVGGLAAVAPARWRLLGVDLAPRPDGLPRRVEWAASLPPAWTGLLLAVEWLDVVPVDVVERADDGLRVLEVDATGAERLGGQADPADERWLRDWWSPAEVGDRAEPGGPRDAAWADAAGRLDRGVAVAVDYAAVPARDVAGTLTGYRAGRQLAPVPDGSCDITAHVLLESCAAAAKADATTILSQREALRRLGLAPTLPTYAGDPTSYLEALDDVGSAAELLDPGGLGAFSWLVQAVGCPLPL